jgi:hypothetical protein
MAKLLVPSDSSWYDELGSVAYYGETEFQRAIELHVSEIFSDYYAFPFAKSITSKLGTSKPDLGLISKSLSEWWIIEVELGKHDLENHVLKQIDDFRFGKYPTPIFTDYFSKQIKKIYKKEIDQNKIKNLLKKRPPKILVIVDEERKEWMDELKKRDVNLCLFQVFKNTKGSNAYRLSDLNGSYPYIKIRESHCVPEKFYGNNLLEIKNPAIIHKNKQNTKIHYLGRQTSWKRISDKGKTYLRFLGKINPLPENSNFCLIQDSRQRLILIKN